MNPNDSFGPAGVQRAEQGIARTADMIAARTGGPVMRVQKADGKQVQMMPVYDAKGQLRGWIDPEKLQPVDELSDTDGDADQVEKAMRILASAARRNLARLETVRKAARPLDAVQLVRELGRQAHLRVRKGGEPLEPWGAYDELRAGAIARHKLPPEGRAQFDALLARTTASSRRELSKRLREIL